VDSVIQAVDIEKWRRKRHVLAGVNLEIQRGEVIGVLGPNGAGKSTLMAILAGLLRPDAGVIRLYGRELMRRNAQARAGVGVALQRPALSPRWTVREIVTFFSLCYNGGHPVDELLARFCLLEKQHVQTRSLSAGEQQRVSLALAFLKPFDVVLLDEPTAGLDPEGRQNLYEEVRQARSHGTAVVYATHLMEEAQQLSDRVLILQAGHQIALASPQALLAQVEGREKVEIRGAHGSLAAALTDLPGITNLSCHGETITLYCHSARDVLRLLLAQDNIPNISCGVLTLEDVFHVLTTGDGRKTL
jgi:ABC-2 type transport system ATP-binding protein